MKALRHMKLFVGNLSYDVSEDELREAFAEFEPLLEVRFVDEPAPPPARPEHREASCVGRWERRWLADRPVLVCSRCGGSCIATGDTLAAAAEENEFASLLEQLTREGRSIL